MAGRIPGSSAQCKRQTGGAEGDIVRHLVRSRYIGQDLNSVNTEGNRGNTDIVTDRGRDQKVPSLVNRVAVLRGGYCHRGRLIFLGVEADLGIFTDVTEGIDRPDLELDLLAV